VRAKSVQLFKLSPSDLTFLWDECPRCFYEKVVYNVRRPRSPMPGIFSVIDSAMKTRLHGRRPDVDGMPAGVVQYGERRVTSQPIRVPGRSSQCVLDGKFDLAIKLDDSTWCIPDLKTMQPKNAHVALYQRQLHAYAFAVEQPAPGSLALSPVTTLGILAFAPDAFWNNGEAALLMGGLRWIEVKRDDRAFLTFLAHVLSVLEAPDPPASALSCGHCHYRTSSQL
jgi:hypothetical protein